ncbi:hypothetical protein IQ06DRAFT_319285 [Phaeosphaeriaceae sp. SRC1lsM3a]|nr:hypothetical protein IQ06DRAFT_319285 [Stagonospora sp. SRC1lsM3a]
MNSQNDQTNHKLKNAGLMLETQIVTNAQRQCLPLCALLQDKLPQELRDIVHSHLITETNATLYDGPDSQVKLANGSSTVQHGFDVDFTGVGMHLAMLEGRMRKGARFHFRYRQGLLKVAFEYFKSMYGFDLASIVSNVGVVLNSKDVANRDKVSQRLNELFILRKSSHVYVYIDANGISKSRISRNFRRIVHATLPILANLRRSGYSVTIIMNPQFAPSTVRNFEHSTFSIVPDQSYRYIFPLEDEILTATNLDWKLERGGSTQRLR